MHYAAKSGQVRAIKALNNLEANINAKDKNGKTPMHYAAENGKDVAINVMYILGGNVDAQDKDGKTPLHYAAENSSMGPWPVEEKDKVDTIKTLHASGANVDAQDEDGSTPMDYAIQSGKLAWVEALHELGANLSAVVSTAEPSSMIGKYLSRAEQVVPSLQDQTLKHLRERIKAGTITKTELGRLPGDLKDRLYIPENLSEG
jgi:ankyrin repeat protein